MQDLCLRLIGTAGLGTRDPLNPSSGASQANGRRLFLGCVFRHDVWPIAMQAAGVKLAEHDGGWLLSVGDATLIVSALDVSRLQLALAFAGVSPKLLATQVYDHLAGR